MISKSTGLGVAVQLEFGGREVVHFYEDRPVQADEPGIYFQSFSQKKVHHLVSGERINVISKVPIQNSVTCPSSSGGP
jgi:hypothetical protein